MSITLKKRGAALSAVLLTASLSLAACGGDDEADGALSGETRTVEADNGSVEIPADPQRIVTVGGTSQPFIDLGGKPVGVTPYYDPDSLPEEQRAVFDAAADIETGDEVDVEKIAKLEPDLILFQGDQAGFEKISKELNDVAPTVFWTMAVEWKEMSDAIAVAGNVTEGLDEQKKDFESSLADITTKYADLIADTTFVDLGRYSISDPGTFVIADIGCSEVGRDDVGLDLPEAEEGEDPLAYTSLPFEQLSSLAEYDVITYPVDGDGEPTEHFAPVVETNTWKALPQVKAGRTAGLHCPGNGSYGLVNRYLDSLDSALAKLSATE